MLTKNEKKALCRFDLFTRRKKSVPVPVQNAKEVFTYRGDQYDVEPEKMLQRLVTMIVKYKKQYAIMILRDNAIPKNLPDHIVVKMENGQPTINRLSNYNDLIKDFAIPEYLSYDIDPYK